MNIHWNGTIIQLLIIHVVYDGDDTIIVAGYQLFISTAESTDFKSFSTYLDRCTCLNAVSLKHFYDNH